MSAPVSPIEHTAVLQLPNGKRQAFTVSATPKRGNAAATALAMRLTKQHKAAYQAISVTSHS